MNVETDEKIFTKSFFLIFAALLFTALVMYALMSTVTEYATSMGSSATIAGLVSGIYIFGVYALEFIPPMLLIESVGGKQHLFS